MLYIAATPIGNMEDISQRALRVFREADFVIAEDTRRTRTLLQAYDIDVDVVSLHAKSSEKVYRQLAERLKHKTAVLVTDAGTPGIADPGGVLVAMLDSDIVVSPIPGPSSVTAALSVAGMKGNQFVFMGYVPHKKGRNSFFAELESQSYTSVFFETPHRIGKTLAALGEFADVDRRVMVGRELTKKFETLYRSTVGGIAQMVPESDFRGEFVIVLEGK